MYILKDVYPFEVKVAEFWVGNWKTNSEEISVVIPQQYVELFDGCHFKNSECLSKATMHARCAAEAAYYDKPAFLRMHESSLKNYLESARKEDNNYEREED